MKVVSIIRQRGQLTIPDSIREMLSWVAPMSPVTISVENPNEITVKPHQKQLDWDKIWKGIKKARSIKGRGKGSLSEFIIKDRQRH